MSYSYLEQDTFRPYHTAFVIPVACNTRPVSNGIAVGSETSGKRIDSITAPYGERHMRKPYARGRRVAAGHARAAHQF